MNIKNQKSGFNLESTTSIYNLQKNFKKKKKNRIIFNSPTFEYKYFDYSNIITNNKDISILPSKPIDKYGIITGERVHNIEAIENPTMPYFIDPFGYVIAENGDNRNYWSIIYRPAKVGDLDVLGNQIPINVGYIVFKNVPDFFNKNEFEITKEKILQLKSLYTFIPNDLINILNNLINKTYITKGIFENELSNILGKSIFKKYKKYLIDSFKVWITKEEADYILNSNEFEIFKGYYIYPGCIYFAPKKHMKQPTNKKSNKEIGKIVSSKFIFDDMVFYNYKNKNLPVNIQNKLLSLNNNTFYNYKELEYNLLNVLDLNDYNNYKKIIINNLNIQPGNRLIDNIKMEIFIWSPLNFKKNNVSYGLKSFIFSELTELDKNNYQLYLLNKNKKEIVEDITIKQEQIVSANYLNLKVKKTNSKFNL